MRYQVIYTKCNPIVAWKNILEEARAFAAKMERVGYTVSIYEHNKKGLHKVK